MKQILEYNKIERSGIRAKKGTHKLTTQNYKISENYIFIYSWIFKHHVEDSIHLWLNHD
jgi:hypothetical protein